MKIQFAILLFSIGFALYGQEQKTKLDAIAYPTFQQFMNTPLATFLGPEPDQQSIDLSDKMPPALMQGMQGSCSAWAVAYGIGNYQKFRRTGEPYLLDGQPDINSLLSPASVYNIRCRELGRKSCTGVDLLDAFSIARNIGIATWRDFPYDSTDITACLKNKLLTPAVLARAKQNAIGFYHMIGFNDIKKRLADSIPVAISIKVDPTFEYKGYEAARLRKIYIYNPDPYASEGLHALVCVGYDEKGFKVFNSYSKNWGSAGCGYIPFEVMQKKITMAVVAYDPIPSSEIVPARQQAGIMTAPGTISGKFRLGEYYVYKNVKISFNYIDANSKGILILFSDKLTNQLLFETFVFPDSYATVYPPNIQMVFKYVKLHTDGVSTNDGYVHFTLAVKSMTIEQKRQDYANFISFMKK